MQKKSIEMKCNIMNWVEESWSGLQWSKWCEARWNEEKWSIYVM